MKFKLLIAVMLFLSIIQYTFSQTYTILVKPADGEDWGYVDLKGNYIIKPQYKKAFEFSEEGLAVVLEKKAKQYQFINTKGEKLSTEVSEFRLKEIFGMNVQGFNSGMVAVRIGEKWGYLNTQGKEVVKATFDKAAEFHEGLGTAQRAGVNYIIDKSGKETEANDSRILALKNFSDGLAPFESKDKKEGFVDQTGKVVIDPNYLSVGYFKNGLAWAKSADGKIGYINKKGDWAIQPQFTAAKDFDAKSGLARVKVTEKWQYTDKSGKVSTLNDAESFEDFSEGLCAGKKGGKTGFYDNTGKWVIEPKFDGIRDFKNGYAAAKSENKWGLIDKTGNWVINPTFSGIKDVEIVK